ncbi:carboxyl transferase domain-containing protein [Lentzea sp. NPDC006480]|uniref:carboxyl transferase domain-containing protein n=1 Tax=Lentzea sp. NPDC006480 TaxID=3157176 RepID=UPI0033A68EBB
MDLRALCDRGTLRLLSDVDSAGVVIARGSVLGRPVIAYATSGSIGVGGSERIVWAVDSAAREGVPVLGLWRCDGPAWEGAGDVFAAMVRAAGRVPQICVVLGSSDGGCGPALSDVVIAGPGGFAADVVCSSDALAVENARLVVSLLGNRGRYSAVPEQPVAGRNLVPALFDSSAVADAGPVELRAWTSPQVVTALGRMGGHTVGVVAATGLLDSAGAAKAARFVRMCDASRVPLVVVADVVRVAGRAAKLLHALASTSVPRVTVVPRAVCGPYFVMNSRPLGASAVFAWPGADVAGAVDEVVSPDATRRRVVEVLAMARERRSSGRIPLQPPILHE